MWSSPNDFVLGVGRVEARVLQLMPAALRRREENETH